VVLDYRHLTSASSSLATLAGPAWRPAAVAGVTEPELKLANDDMQFAVHTELVELRY